MSLVHPAVAVRRLLARRPIVYWLAAAVLCAVVVVSVHRDVRALRDERDRWSTTQAVLVARHDAAPGELIDVEAVEVPIAIAPPTAARIGDDRMDRPIRRHIAAGDIVTELDLAPRPGPLALVPAGWRAVPIVESPASASQRGDHVEVVSDGVLIAEQALVVDSHDSVTLVAVPADVAALVALAASTGSVTLLRVP